MDDVYDTFYRDKEEEEEAKVTKASEDMKLSIMKEKFLAMVESEKARVKDYTKLVVTDRIVDYVLEKYGNKWKSGDEIAYFILEDLWLKYEKDDKGKRKLVEDNGKGNETEHHHLKVNKDDKGKGKLVEDNGKEKVHDILNKVGLLLNVRNDCEEGCLEDENSSSIYRQDWVQSAAQISSDEDDDEDPTAPTSTRSKAPTASSSIRSRAPIASTSNAQAASTASRGCVIALFAPNAPNAPPPSATRKRKHT
ncbi:hypothetical protein Tco_0851556 [Tanacetum coccineum]